MGWFGEFCNVGKFQEKKMIQYFFDGDDFCFSALQISVFPKKKKFVKITNKNIVIMVVGVFY